MLEAMSSGARSEAERITAKLLDGSGFTGWSANTPACGYVLDFAFEASKIAIEIDGMAFHSDAAFQRDRTRQNDLVANGWTVLRFTWNTEIRSVDADLARIRATKSRSGAGLHQREQDGVADAEAGEGHQQAAKGAVDRHLLGTALVVLENLAVHDIVKAFRK